MTNINFQTLFFKHLILGLVLLLTSAKAFAQEPSPVITMKLALINDTTGLYGVYVLPLPGIDPFNTLIVSGQVTIVAPTGFAYTNFTDVNGNWEDTFTRVNAPPENPEWDYISVGFEGDSGTQLVEGEETLLFTFERDGLCPDSILHLIVNGEDPFDIENNSENTVPGNEITFVDFAPTGLEYYNYHSNYAVFAADCNDCDGDGLSNGQEDTNGDGVYTPGVDASDLCDKCDPFHPETATLSLQGVAENGVICADDLTDTAYIFIAVEGGWPPYTIIFNDGTNNITINNYESNDTIRVIPNATSTYSLVSVTDSENCVADVNGLGGTAEITVEGPITIDADPISVSECSDNGSGFSATVTNAGAGTMSFLWQVSTDNGANFIDLQDGTPYSDVMTTSMTISDVAGLHDYQYRIKVWTETCDTTFSIPAILSVEGPLSFTADPQDVTECGTNGTSFTATSFNSGVGTMNSLWQISTDNGTTFTDLANAGVYSGTAANTLTISNTEDLNGHLYRMKVFTAECDTVFSQAALLTVEGPFTITAQPQDASNCGGEEAIFVVEVDNPASGTILYQWQQNDGNDWVSLTNNNIHNGVQSDTLSISNVVGMDGDQVRVLISSATCTAVISDPATITEEGTVNFTNDPDDFTTCHGSAASFTVEANTGGLNTPTYTWQVSSDNGVTFTDLADGGVYSGTDVLTLNISDVAGLYDNRYRIKGFSGLCDTTFSADAILTVEGPLSIDVQPVDETVCSGDGISFPATISNAGSGVMTLQWQVSSNGGGLWSNLINNDTYNGVHTDNLSIENVEGLDGNQYQLLIETGTCATLTTVPLTLTVDGVITYSAQPEDVQICDDGTAVSFSATTVNDNNGTETYQWQVSSDGISFSDITPGAPYADLTTTTMSISDVTGLNGRYYRLATSVGVCAVPYYSDAALLTVEGPIEIELGGDPDDVTLCADEPVNFIIEANSNSLGELLFQWQEFDGTTWEDIANDLVYNGVQTDTLSINNLTGLNGYEYRVIMTTAECTDQVISEAALLTLEGPVTYSANPEDVQVCDDGTPISFSATPDNGNSGTMTYQWEVSTDGGNTYNPVPVAPRYQNTNTTTMTITNVNGLNGRLYRLATSLPTCADFHSEPALLTVEVPVTVSPGGHPDPVTACSGEPIIFNISATTNGLGDILYQWQENDGSGWTNITNGGDAIYNGVQTDTLSIGDVVGLDGYQYRVLLNTPECGTSVPSNAAALTVEGPLVFSAEPEDYDQCSGLSAFFEVSVDNLTGNGTTVYQWQENDGSGWLDLGDAGVYSGTELARLDISDVAGLGDNEYRVVIGTATCVADTSVAALLSVEGPIAITAQPQDVTECSGEGNTFSVTVNNPGSGGADEIDYQWYISFDEVNWTALPNNDNYNGVNTNILSLIDVAGLGNAFFHVEASTANCSFVTSASASLVVEGPLEFTDNPDNSVFCDGGAATTFSATVLNNGAGSANYQWQVSSDGVNFADLTDGAIYSGVNTTTLTVLDPTGLSGRLYRLASGTGECASIYSDAAEMVIEGPITIDNQPDDITTCSDLGQFFAVDANNAGEGFVFYQWQENDGSGWSDLNNDGNFNGVRTDTLSIDVTGGLGGNQYRVRVWTPTCDTLESAFATLTVEGPLSFTDEPDDVVICSGDATSFSVAIDNPGAGTPTYQWEISTNGGQTFVDVTDGGVYSGATTATLAISDVAGLNGFKYRSTIQTGECASTASYAANLTVEGPITFNSGPDDASICSNVDHTFVVDVTNPGVGTMALQWQSRANSGAAWSDLANDDLFTGVTTRELRIDSTGGLNGTQYQLVITTSVCTDISSIATLTVRDACLDGTCDFDLDGQINDVDEDDDNDGLDDVWEDYITNNSLAMIGIQVTMDNCNPDSDGDGITDDQEDPDDDGINNGEETDDDGVFDGDPLDPCDPVLSAACVGISLDLKVMLHGALLGTNGTLMRDDMRELGLLPLTEPYTAMPTFTHVGEGGGETVDPSVFDVTGDDAIVDWVFVELRDADQVENVIATRAALLQRDGDIKDLDGTSFLGFQVATAGNYYVAVRHRNHLGVMTNFAFGLSPITQTFDFTDPDTETYGTYAQKDIGTVTAMWSGDINSNGNVIYQGPNNDVLTMFLNVLSDPGNTENLANYISDGYYTTDINLDGRTIYQGPGNDRNFILFQTVLVYPTNEDFFANYVVKEQIPD